MTFVRRLHPSRALITILTLCAWLIATNHCALGLMNRAAPKEHEHCPGHDTPKKGGDSDGDQFPCCKTIHATPAPLGKMAIDPAKMLFALQFSVVTILSPSQVERPLPSEALDTGPPFLVSFAESVLQRSLLSHAPPLV